MSRAPVTAVASGGKGPRARGKRGRRRGCRGPGQTHDRTRLPQRPASRETARGRLAALPGTREDLGSGGRGRRLPLGLLPAPSQRWAGSARAGRRPRPRTRCPRVCAPRADGTVWGVTCGQRSRQKQRGLPRVKFQIRTKTSGRSKPRRKEGTSKVGGRCPATAAAPGPRPWITAAPHGAPPKRAPAPEGQEGSRQRARGARDAGGWGPGAGRRAAGLLLPCPLRRGERRETDAPGTASAPLPHRVAAARFRKLSRLRPPQVLQTISHMRRSWACSLVL